MPQATMLLVKMALSRRVGSGVRLVPCAEHRTSGATHNKSRLAIIFEVLRAFRTIFRCCTCRLVRLRLFRPNARLTGPRAADCYAYPRLTTDSASAHVVFFSMYALIIALLEEMIPDQRLFHAVNACHEYPM